MNVKSTGCITTYDSLFFQSSPIISTLDHVKGLIEAYKTSFTTEKNIIISAKLLIERISQLEDISIKRECFCRLLKLEIEEIQNLIVKEIVPLFDFKTFYYDIQHNQAQELIQLEKIVSEIIESKLSLDELNFLVPICSLYRDILEHLWLLPYLEFGNHCSHLLIQNKDSILSNMKKQWIESLYQLASKKKINRLIPKNLEKSILRIFEPLPKSIVKDMDIQKSVINKSRGIPLTLLTIMANVYSNQGDLRRAIFHEEAFLKLLTEKPQEMSSSKEVLIIIMQRHGNLAGWKQILGKHQSAINHGTQALQIAKVLQDPYKTFTYLMNIGSLNFKERKGQLALSFYKKAQNIAQTLNDRKNEGRALVSLAEAYRFINNNEEAIRCYQVALNLTEEKSDLSSIYHKIGCAQAEMQRYQQAKEAYHKALDLLTQGDFISAIQIHANLARLFNNFGRYETAIFHAEIAFELTQHPLAQINELEALESRFSALTVLGNIYATIGNYEKEFDYQIRALRIAEKLESLEVVEKLVFFSDSLEMAYMNLGNAYCHRENYFEAKNYYFKALRITKNASMQGLIIINLGHILFFSDMLPEAISYYKKANEIDNKEIKQHSLNGLGIAYQAVGNIKQAIQSYKNFIFLSQASEDRRSEAIGYHNLGEVYRKFDHRLAEVNYRKSINVYATLHQELKSYSQWQITFFELQAMPLLRLESLLLEQGRTKEALQIADFRRSRALISSLTEKFQFQKNDNLLSSGLTSQEMQALAYKMNTCFILYSLSFENMDNVTVWVVPPQGEITCQQLPLRILTEEVEEATHFLKTFPFIVESTIAKRRPFVRPKKNRSSLTHAFLDELIRENPDESATSAFLQSFKKRLSLWYEALIAPLESYLPKDLQQVVTIIPDGFLAQIPFAAFLDKEGTYLIEKHPISIAPSIGILKLLDEIPKDFSENSLIIGNPTTPHLKDTLPLAEKEAQTIVAPLLATTSERILLQDSATVQHVVERMRDARWIHLACHGLTGTKPEEKLDPHSVFEGLFKLAPDESHSKGYLHAQEIASLTLRTELVFMSACFSGRGKLHREGSVGPVWSFLAAGVLSTAATYWELQDSELTLQMVDTFYRHLLGIEVEKLNKAQALQKAMVRGIEQKRDKPHLWGAFFLSGLHE
ncbi:CHAT domain-containing tetratricopeptide repeat protein [Candidatus Protochlamydia amoebophila]|uniref:CHAT domain-containing protein n=1 Tax=Candidatus Protochlamydia amoebophila TaxID=362787 RepID=A0A0C1HIE7_9BACT|nr:CHAT domain-containing tetratricopeptide repeat protein [Candidatus Protochlamydia amoebophila]KIC74343.1 hypothetical protein DB44_AL00370 [Candidatus Protochlamydia amoebophila]